MKQFGLCVMRETGFEFCSTDSHSAIDGKLRVLFPKLFDWISESEPDDATASSWLICMKPPYSRKSLVVYSDDQSLPTGFDIFTACQLSKSKVGFQNRVLYLGMSSAILYFILNFLVVTRDPVPGRVLRTWRPSAISVKCSTKSEPDPEHAVRSESDTDDRDKSSSSLPTCRVVHNRVNLEEEREVIIVTSGKSISTSESTIQTPDRKLQ